MLYNTNLSYKDSIVFDFCKLYLNNNYLINIVNEGQFIQLDMLTEFNKTIKDYYKDNPFTYISHRVHSYSLDPKLYSLIPQFYNIQGFAIVSTNFRTIENTNVEKLFFKKQLRVFSNLNEAITWANNLVT